MKRPLPLEVVGLFEQMTRLWDRYGFVFLEGLWGTVWLSAVSVLVGTLIGTVLAIMKLSKVKPLGWIVDLYTWVLRGTPVLLQLYLFYFMLPKIMPFEMSDVQSILVALVVNASAYIAEIIRAGIQAVDVGQTEAARSLGMSSFNTMVRIVLPQAVKNILPALGNEYITMVKSTSLGSVFFLPELMTAQKTVQSATYLPIPSLLIAGIIYLVVTTILSFALRFYERRLKRSERDA